jgi:hypothetical protein
MALPVRKAMDLAKDMKSKGILGSIEMGEPENASNKGEHMGSGDEMDESPEKEGDSPMMGIASDMIDAMESKDASALASLLQELVDRIQSEDKEQDSEDMMEK